MCWQKIVNGIVSVEGPVFKSYTFAQISKVYISLGVYQRPPSVTKVFYVPRSMWPMQGRFLEMYI
jgi:hypothetical protein